MQKRIINSLLFLLAIHASVANAQIYAYVEHKEYDTERSISRGNKVGQSCYQHPIQHPYRSVY